MVCFMPGRSCGFRKKRGEGNSEVMKNMVKTCRGGKNTAAAECGSRNSTLPAIPAQASTPCAAS